MVEVEARHDERSVAIFTRAPLADADSLSFLGRPMVPHNTTDLEANAFRDLRHRFAAVDELSTRVQIELFDSYLEDSSEDFIVAWNAPNCGSEGTILRAPTMSSLYLDLIRIPSRR